jgi:hypothetical protein
MKWFHWMSIGIVIIILLFIADIIITAIPLNVPNNSGQSFNNWITPVVSLLSLAVYAIALFVSIRQNKTLISQNLKPVYENNFERIRRSFDDEVFAVGTTRNGYDAGLAVFTIGRAIRFSGFYNEDIELLSKGMLTNDVNYYRGRGYLSDVNELMTVIDLITRNLEMIKRFIISVNKSNLLPEDKEDFRLQVMTELLFHYPSYRHQLNLRIDVPIINYGVDIYWDKPDSKLLEVATAIDKLVYKDDIVVDP